SILLDAFSRRIGGAGQPFAHRAGLRGAQPGAMATPARRRDPSFRFITNQVRKDSLLRGTIRKRAAVRRRNRPTLRLVFESSSRPRTWSLRSAQRANVLGGCPMVGFGSKDI